ncbi:MAG: tol-pal system protein YbgF [Acidobacteria bacterium]|nr:MAG: tol-pal system protein YbgF [Acidobacteriota bacterium]
MRKVSTVVALLGIGIWGLAATPSTTLLGKRELQAIEKLTQEVTVLQRDIRDLQEMMSRNSGELTTLVNQTNDSIALANQTIQDIRRIVRDTHTRVSGALGSLNSRLLAQETALNTLNDRLAEITDQLRAVNTELAAIKERSLVSIDPTDPIQVFGAAYGDFLRGNYQLAIDQFRQFLLKFPHSERADDAQYWIGESLFRQGLYEEAIAEFDHLVETYPQGNRVPAARLKKALALLALEKTDQAVEELRQLIESFPDAPAALAAKQKLEELGVPLEKPRKPTRRRRRRR